MVQEFKPKQELRVHKNGIKDQPVLLLQTMKALKQVLNVEQDEIRGEMMSMKQELKDEIKFA